MSTFAVEPGTRLADRYRLEDRVSVHQGSVLWKAIDEVLARPVSVRTFDEDFPRTSEVVTAARAASRLGDARLTQVFDAYSEETRSLAAASARTSDGPYAYVVSEWAGGDSLVDLLAGGALESDRAAGLIVEVAEGLASAHKAGLAHLCLTAESVHVGAGGTVKLVGVGVDAALTGVPSEDPAVDDAVGLGMLLYAALTGHWPGTEDVGLPPAPVRDGRVCSPRQVLAGVSSPLDAITCRALFQESRRGAGPLLSPAEVADALAEVPRRSPIAYAAAPPPYPSADVTTRREAPGPGARPRSGPPAPPTRGHRGTHRSPDKLSRTLTALITVLVLGAIGVGAWAIGRTLGAGAPDTPTATPTPPAAVSNLKIHDVESFDPEGDGKESENYVAQAVDDDPGSSWRTEGYKDRLSLLKGGVGLLVDLSDKVAVHEVVADLGKVDGAKVVLKAGNSKDADALETVAEGDGGVGKVTFTPEKPVVCRYLVVWFTELPPDGGRFRGNIYDINVKGSAEA